MAGCVLRASIKEWNPTQETIAFLGALETHSDRETLRVCISEAEQFQEQVDEVLHFFDRFPGEIEALVSCIKPEVVELDFGIWRSEDPMQSVCFPARLVSRAGEWGIALRTSVYYASDQ